MTRDVAGPADSGPVHANAEADILAALWEEVPFPRLPLDAPPEIRELVVNIENPKRVYAIHHSSRRHYLQLLVEKFVTQLRYGCGHKGCTTSSCFSCRRRVAGKAPLRRYNPTSARTLAVYLAGQDNPESRLCPHLQSNKSPSDAIKPLVFSSKHTGTAKNGRSKPARATYSPQATSPDRFGQTMESCGDHKENGTESISISGRTENPTRRSSRQLSIEEKAIVKDYRSFAANMFGTVAYKMLEWLTPNTLAATAEKSAAATQISDMETSDGSRTNFDSDLDAEDQLSMPSTVSSSESGSKSSVSYNLATEDENDVPTKSRRAPTLTESRRNQDQQPSSVRSPIQPHRSAACVPDATTRIRTSSLARPLSLPVAESGDEFQYEDALVSPKSLTDVKSKSLVRPSSNLSRASSQVCLSDTFEADFDIQTHAKSEGRLFRDGALQSHDRNGQQPTNGVPSAKTCDYPQKRQVHDPNDMLDLERYLPQSLSVLNPQVVNFICDVLQEDATSENHLLSPPTIGTDLRRASDRSKPWKRNRESSVLPYPRKLKLEWKLFVEQSIFNVLSDPWAILDSFVTRDGSIDSQTLWYCMLRLTRVAPSLVFDSLWMAVACLFTPPPDVRTPGPMTTRLPARAQRSFTNKEAGLLMFICFHALVAAAPLVTDSRQLHDISRIRSQGLALASGGAVARQPDSLCLQYDDTFTDEMALRLAKRLLTAISARRCFDTLATLESAAEDSRAAGADVMDVVLTHLDSSVPPWFNFTKTERGVHEKRIPIILLDWARAVMLHEWKGQPVVAGDGPFRGALELMAAMYRKRNALMINEIHFRCEYFGDRLDVLQMPVAWLASESCRNNTHLLDYPYIFSPASLVSYFRSINFSRMSRSYEESSSLQSRISTIITRDSLVTETHQKNILQDLLRVPAARYLILDIGRRNVLGDAFDQLWRREERELVRPLKVHLGEDGGEQGFDSGGVQQEFFRLAVAEALDPKYGAFTVDEQTHMAWFQPGSLEPVWKFELVGMLVSLAVYNGLTLPVTFPTALYRKLLEKPVSELHHIADGWPHLANGLTTLLDWNENNGSVEDVFAMTYEFSVSVFGQPVSREMRSSTEASWPQSPESSDQSLAASNPTDAPAVTADNRIAYVSDYIRYLTSLSVEPQFEAFSRGFRACLQPKSLTLLTPTLLQSLVEGIQDIDIHELRRTTRYVGWDSSHRTVRDFWSIVKRYDERMKRKLLEFVTASDRVPVGGLANIQFVVQKNGEEEREGGHLPTAYTCYGTLLLPEYKDKDVLRERLNMALENAQGFGFA